MPSIRSLSPLATVVLSLVLGCGGDGDNLPREAVSGAVTLDGQPLEKGTIQFLPTSPDQAVAAGAVIQGGKYDIPQAQGPIPGGYKVMISADGGVQDTEVEGMPGGAGVPNKERVPAQYNVQSTLTAEVKPGQSNTFDFPLTSAAKKK